MVDAVLDNGLRECEEKLEAMDVYEKSELINLLGFAQDAVKQLENKKLELEAALPEMMARKQHQADRQEEAMKSLALLATDVEKELKELQLYTGKLCTLLAPQSKQLVQLETKIKYLTVLLEVETLSGEAKNERPTGQ
jgi:hypothetical protein